MSRSSFDDQLFTWENWADGDEPMSMKFSDITLKVPVGDFPAGTKFPFALLLGGGSLLVLVDDNKEERGFTLNISVGEEVQPEESCEIDSGSKPNDDACGCGHAHESSSGHNH